MSMTDEQIVKALECCIQIDVYSCYRCPLYERGQGCLGGDIRVVALDLIKRQQAEIENLKADKEAIINGQLTLQKMYLESRAKAVRECIKKIKSHSSVTVATTNGQELYETKAYTIRATKLDEIVKEMTEEK